LRSGERELDRNICHPAIKDESRLVFFPNGASVQLNMIERYSGQAPAKHALRREEIDWPGLRAAAVAIGIRPAARQAARDLPPDEQERFVQRAMKRCSRQKWLVKSRQDKADAIATSPTALSANVRKGADVLSETLAEDSRATRIGLSAAARKAAETFAKMPGSKVIKQAQAHRHVTASSSLLHGWEQRKEQDQSQVAVNIALLDARPVVFATDPRLSNSTKKTVKML
jgi:hypothetical protein